MVQVSTNGTGQFFELSAPGPSLGAVAAPGAPFRIQVSAPGMHIRASVVQRTPSVGAAAALAASPSLSSEALLAIQENEMEEIDRYVEVYEATPIHTAGMTDVLSRDGEKDPCAMFAVTTDGATRMLAMVDDGFTSLWYAPTPAVSSMQPSHGAVTSAAIAKQPVVTHQFLIPQRVLAPRPVPGMAIAGVGRVLVRLFKFKFVQSIIDKGVEWLATHIEKKKKDEGLKLFEPGFPKIDTANLAARFNAPGQRMLLLVHGIFSNAAGGFGELLGTSLETHLRHVYGDRIVAWDHFTVSKGAFENAEQMLRALPDGLDVDIVCHSRGAVVTRCALEHPTLMPLAAQKFARIGKVVFVAGANRGSALALPAKVDALMNAFWTFGSVLGGGVVLSVVLGVLRVLAHGVGDLPGISDMSPLSQILREVNAQGRRPSDRYLALRANFDAKSGIGGRLANIGADAIFRQAGNDLVVPFEGALGFDDDMIRLPGAVRCVSYGTESEAQGAIFHNNFFKQPGVLRLLAEELT